MSYGINCYAQESNFFGSRNESLARSTIALTDSWALFYNPSGLKYHDSQVLFGYQSKYTSLGINDGAFGFTFPIKNTALGVGASFFGDNLLNKSKIIIAAAHSIGKTSLGIKSTYDQISIKEVGTKGIIYLDIGGQISINKEITLGMLITNLNQAKFDTLALSNPYTSVQVGINYHPHNKLILLAQVEKNISDPTIIRFALEYVISNNVSIRTGIVPSPASASTGIGLSWEKFKLDFSGSYQQYLGWSGGASIGIPIFADHAD